jgi:hypothetical protein
MKKILLAAFFACTTLLSMSQAKEGTLEYMKTRQPAAVIEFPYTEDVVEGAIKSHFEKQGAKITDSKGLMIIKGASVSEETLDLYFKIERKSRKEKEFTTVYLAAGHPGENIAARTSEERFGLAQSQAYLNSVAPYIENHSVGLQVIEQEETIKKANKKYNGLVTDSIDYQKKKLALDQKITDNSKLQEDQRVELDRQKQILEALKARKKP